jgi:hypothetical protein
MLILSCLLISVVRSARLLRKMDYSPKANARRTEARGASPAQRNAQFEHIAEQRAQFQPASRIGDLLPHRWQPVA